MAKGRCFWELQRFFCCCNSCNPQGTTVVTLFISSSWPLPSYNMIHQSAKLSAHEQKIITDWASKVPDSLEK
jgi:hypothetical protein